MTEHPVNYGLGEAFVAALNDGTQEVLTIFQSIIKSRQTWMRYEKWRSKISRRSLLLMRKPRGVIERERILSRMMLDLVKGV
jgi:hypothetical protein